MTESGKKPKKTEGNLTRAAIETRFTTRKPGAVGTMHQYAVLMPLVDVDGALHFLFEVRSPHLDRQPGEICFPGGAREAQETPLMCALRETWEELAIPREQIHLISKADTVYGAGASLISCYLAEVELQGMCPSAEEVSGTFLVPVDWFMRTAPQVEMVSYTPVGLDTFPNALVGFPDGYQWMEIRQEVPIYQYHDRVIWGLTARMVLDFVRIMKGEKA